jgi:peroxiredoxin
MFVAVLFVRLCLAVIFAVAGISKIIAPVRTRRSLEQFGVPRRLSRILATALPLLEVAVALGLARPALVHASAAGALSLLSLFTIAVLLKLLKGSTPECACFGAIRAAPISGWTLVRNLLLASAALPLIYVPESVLVTPAATGVSSPTASIVFALGLGSSFAVAAWAMFRKFRQAAARSRILGVRSASLERLFTHAGGLALGMSAPRFSLPTLTGGLVTLERLAQGGRSAVVVFASSACPQCALILPEVARLQERAAGQLAVALVLSGDPHSSRRMLGDYPINVAATDDDARTAQMFRVTGLPSAVLIGPQGTIASRTASGTHAVLNLLARF